MLKVIELFAGIGAQRQALKEVGIEHYVVAISKIDKYACIAYEALHGKTRNVMDELRDNDINSEDLCDRLR